MKYPYPALYRITEKGRNSLEAILRVRETEQAHPVELKDFTRLLKERCGETLKHAASTAILACETRLAVWPPIENDERNTLETAIIGLLEKIVENKSYRDKIAKGGKLTIFLNVDLTS